MRALLLSEYKHLELVESPTPSIADDEVLIRVRACGICGSDIHGFDGSTGRRIPPIVMGHEAAGVIEHVGSAVRGFAPDDRVTFDSMINCGECAFCRRGEVNLCDNRRVLGVSCGEYRRHGAFAEYVNVPARIVYRLPDRVGFEHAAMVEPISVAVHAVALAHPELGETAVVVGAGMVGSFCVQAARLAGCTRVIAVDLDDARLALATKLGATDVLNPRSTDVPAAVRELTGGAGADTAFEVVGAQQPVETAIASVRKGGRVVLVGNVSPTVQMPLQSVVTRQVALLGSCASAGEYPACLELLASGAIQVEPLISAVAPLEEGPRWFERLYAHEPGLMKVILRP